MSRILQNKYFSVELTNKGPLLKQQTFPVKLMPHRQNG